MLITAYDPVLPQSYPQKISLFA